MKRIIAASVCALALSALPSVAWGQYAPQYYQPYPAYQAAQTPVYWWWQPPQQQQMPQRMVQPRQAMNVIGPVQQVQASLPQAYVQAPAKAEELPAPKAEAPVAAPVTSASGGVCDCCQPSCCDSCCDPCKKGGYYAGVGFYYIKAVWDTNPAFRTAIAPPVSLGAQTDFDYDYEVTPLAWIGYTSASGIGAQIRWWYYDQSDSIDFLNTDPNLAFFTASPLGLPTGPGAVPVFPAFPVGGSALVTSSLELSVWDFEGTYLMGSAARNLMFSGGLRYAHLAQDYQAVVRAPLPPAGPGFADVLDSGHNFNGVGPTVSLTGNVQVGNTGLRLFATGRTSLLWGEAEQFAQFTPSSPPAAPTPTRTTTSRDTLLPVAELEAGVEWARPIGGGELFVRAAFAGQAWFGAGNSSNNSDIPSNLPVGPPVAPNSVDNDVNLGFFGLMFSAGARF